MKRSMIHYLRFRLAQWSSLASIALDQFIAECIVDQ
jgi:hypothetical protein